MKSWQLPRFFCAEGAPQCDIGDAVGDESLDLSKPVTAVDLADLKITPRDALGEESDVRDFLVDDLLNHGSHVMG
jgi:hypothetical protein